MNYLKYAQISNQKALTIHSDTRLGIEIFMKPATRVEVVSLTKCSEYVSVEVFRNTLNTFYVKQEDLEKVTKTYKDRLLRGMIHHINICDY